MGPPRSSKMDKFFHRVDCPTNGSEPPECGRVLTIYQYQYSILQHLYLKNIGKLLRFHFVVTFLCFQMYSLTLSCIIKKTAISSPFLFTPFEYATGLRSGHFFKHILIYLQNYNFYTRHTSHIKAFLLCMYVFHATINNDGLFSNIFWALFYKVLVLQDWVFSL